MSKNRIKGITIEIAGNTSKLNRSFKEVQDSLKKTQATLRDTNKLLKLDPTNTDLLKQKQKQLKKAIEDTTVKLKSEKATLKEMEKSGSTKYTQEQQDALQREIVETENELKKLKQEYQNVGSVAGVKMQAVGSAMKTAGSKISNVGKTLSTRVSLPLAAIGGIAIKSANDWESPDLSRTNTMSEASLSSLPRKDNCNLVSRSASSPDAVLLAVISDESEVSSADTGAVFVSSIITIKTTARAITMFKNFFINKSPYNPLSYKYILNYSEKL